MGDGNDIGLYTEDYFNKQQIYNQATAGRFGYNVMLGKINLADSCKIIIFGCNVSYFAQELSWRFGQIGRGDITVTGADNSVFEKSGRAFVDGNENGNNNRGTGRRKPGHFWTYKNGIVIGNGEGSWSYR